MTSEERLLVKELAFIEARRARFQYDMKVVRMGNITAIVNGRASRDSSFFMYLNDRWARAWARLTEIRNRKTEQ